MYRRCFWICFALDFLLIVFGFLIPPVGVIDGSVLIAVGEIGLFPLLGFADKALSEGKSIKASRGEFNIEVNDEK